MRTPAILSLAVVLASCGDGLYDAAGLPAVDDGGLTCGDDQVVCAADVTPTCRAESVTLCGSGCADCTATAPPAGTEAVCNLGRAPDGHGQCGYACAGGFVACGTDQCCGATAIAAGDATSYALLSDGTVRAWGSNHVGEIGDGSLVARPTPTPVLLPSTAIAIGAGSDHACAVLAGGAVRCWGNNSSGQVTGSSTSPSVETPAATPVTTGAVAVAVGASHTCALLGAGTVNCWGSNLVGQTVGAAGVTGATAIAAGRRHTCVIAGGAVKCWGDNGLGQLGGTPAGGMATPLASGIQHLAAYADHTCAASGTSNGGNLDDALQCWGDVLGPTFLFATPQPSPAIPRRDVDRSTIRFAVDRLTTGRSHVCVRGEATIECLGTESADGQLGGTSLAPESTVVPLSGTPPAAALSAGADHTCAILPTGALRCWGRNAEGQLGDGTTTTPAAGTVVTPKGT